MISKELNSWTTGTPMPTARFYIASSTVGDKVYVIGGYHSAVLEIYDPVTNSWSTGKPMPTARYSLTSSVIDGKIYAIGGSGTNAGDKVELYDPVTNS